MAFDAPLRKAITAIGGPTKASRLLGITPGAVMQWKRAPANHLIRLSELSGVPVRDLRPDLRVVPEPQAVAAVEAVAA